MIKTITQNFRGSRALVIHKEDRNREVLCRVLRRLGLVVQAVTPDTVDPELIGDCDVIFFDADEGTGAVFDGMPHPDVACIALIGVEAPSRLARVIRLRCAGYLMKPVRTSGIFTALLLAVNEFQQRMRDAQERDLLKQRLRGRRAVTKAVVHLMALHNMDEDAVYRHLRHESMRRRIAIDEIAREILEQPDTDDVCSA